MPEHPDSIDLPVTVRTPRPPVSLGGWEFYFLTALFFYAKGLTQFHPLENLAFAVFLLAPLSLPRWRRVRGLLAWPVAIALLYHDSWLPPPAHIMANLPELLSFNLSYLTELGARFIRARDIAILVILWGAWYFITQRLRVGVILVGIMAALAFTQSLRPTLPASAQNCNGKDGIAVQASAHAGSNIAASGSTTAPLDNILDSFYATEATRKVTLPSAAAPAFDIVFIHVCSLSWNDVHAAGLDHHPLWKRFDILFTQFNSAASYSGPAALRLLRAPCGQPRQSALYAPATDACYLMGDLQQDGYQRELALNHDGHFDNFLQLVQQQKLDVAPLPLDGLPVTQRAFDNTPIRDDLDVLSRWLNRRSTEPASRVALYYNTLSLHDGNRIVGQNSSSDTLALYRQRLTQLLDDLDTFMDRIAASKRNVVLVLIPEHGAAVAGDSMQIAGLRDIPTPSITRVPVGIKIIGPSQRNGDSVTIDQPTSYLAMSAVLQHLLQQPPFTGAGFDPATYARDLPTTRLVSQNADTIVLEHAGRYYLRLDAQSDWTPLPADAAGHTP